MGTFEQIAFNPAEGLRDESYDTTPVSEEAAREQIQGRLDELRDQINNHLVNELENATTDYSGAERIGSAPISGIPDKYTVHEQLVELRAQLTAVWDGELTPLSVTNEKLAVDVKVGSLASLTTTETGSVQGAINELDAEIGDITGLSTDAKTSLVAAINEIDSASVDTENIVNGAVSETKLATGAVTETKLGTIQSITLDSGDTVTYDSATDTLNLNVSGCTSVQLMPALFGTSTSAPSGTYPKGTIYLTHEA